MIKPLSLSRSFAWVSASLMLSQGLRLVQGVIVARWLGPEEMGLVAYIYSILTLLDLLRAIGAEQIYVVRSPAEPAAERQWLAGCWNARLVLSGLVGLAMFLGGLVVSALGGEERLGVLLMMLSLLSPLMSARSAELIHQQKVQDFAPLSKFEMAAALLQTVLPLAVVYFYRSAEALVLANLAAMALAAILSHLIFPMQFALRLPPALRDELLFYGKNNIAVSVLATLHTNLDNFAVGSFIGRGQLGIYATGYRLAMAPHGMIQPIAQRILTPSYRRAKDVSMMTLLMRWRAGFGVLAAVYAALGGTLILFADLAVRVLLGPGWERTGDILVLASFIAYFRGMTVSISPLLLIMGFPQKDAHFKALEVLVFCVFVAVGAVTQSLHVLILGGVASYFLAFWLRWDWWRTQAAAAMPSWSGWGEMSLSAVGALALLLAAYVGSLHIEPYITLPVYLSLGLPVIALAGRKLARTINRSYA